MVNLHFSLLPRWRGAAPVERALLAGDAETGVCLMQLEEGLDTGPVFGCERVPIAARTTAAALRADLVRVGTDLLVGQPRGRPRRPTAPDRRADVRGQDRAGRAGDRLVPAGRGARPPGAPRRGLDDVPGPASEGPRRRGRARPPVTSRRSSWRPARSTATGSAPAADRWCSARCSPRAGRRWRWRRGGTEPGSPRASGSGRSALGSRRRLPGAAAHRPRGRLRQPGPARAAGGQPARRPRPGLRHRTWSTGPPACAGRATSSSTASSSASPRPRSAPCCGSAPTSSASPGSTPTPR